jgi:hypothetical protein
LLDPELLVTDTNPLTTRKFSPAAVVIVPDPGSTRNGALVGKLAALEVVKLAETDGPA